FEHDERLHSGLVVPLVARSRILGTLSLVRGQSPEPYEEDDLDFADDLARSAAVAIDNAQLYREAEERGQASRVLASVGDGVFFAFRGVTEGRAVESMRTGFVSTVSHELRTPLAAIYGAAMTLRRKDVALDDAQRATLLDVVSGEADRLARTVNDILWASR